MSESPAGKGDNPRPFSVPLDEYGQKYDRIFGVHEDEFTGLEEEPHYKCSQCGNYMAVGECDVPNCPINESH